MDSKQLMGRIIDVLYDGLTGGSGDLPLPDNVMVNWLTPGVPFHESFFDFAIAGPYAGPSPATLEEFRRLVELFKSEAGGAQPQDQAFDSAKIAYQQNLLGSYEQFSRLVNFIPLPAPTPTDSEWEAEGNRGKFGNVSVVYSQAGQQLSQVYSDTLTRCEVADEPITDQQQKIIDRMRALLFEEVEVEDFLTGEKKTEPRESRMMTAYKAKRNAYDNAVIDYATRLANANNGSARELVEWTRTGGIYRRRALEARRDWEAAGYKNDVERAQATLGHILGSSMVQYKQNLLDALNEIEDNISGAYGYPFHPASVIPGAFARTEGWSTFETKSLDQWSKTSSSSRSGSASGGLHLGLFSIGGSGGAGRTEYEMDFTGKTFELGYQYTTVEIMRPTFNPNFFLSRGWRPKDSFIRDYEALHSDGKKPPETTGAMIGYPTKALFVRKLKIRSVELADHLRSQSDYVEGGGFASYGPFVIGGQYQQSNHSSESSYKLDKDMIEMQGLTLVAFMSSLFPYTANPSPDITAWI